MSSRPAYPAHRLATGAPAQQPKPAAPKPTKTKSTPGRRHKTVPDLSFCSAVSQACLVPISRSHPAGVVFKAMMKRTSGDSALAADMTQHASLVALTKGTGTQPGQYDPAKGALIPWLVTVADNARKALIRHVTQNGSIHLQTFSSKMEQYVSGSAMDAGAFEAAAAAHHTALKTAARRHYQPDEQPDSTYTDSDDPAEHDALSHQARSAARSDRSSNVTAPLDGKTSISGGTNLEHLAAATDATTDAVGFAGVSGVPNRSAGFGELGGSHNDDFLDDVYPALAVAFAQDKSLPPLLSPYDRPKPTDPDSVYWEDYYERKNRPYAAQAKALNIPPHVVAAAALSTDPDRRAVLQQLQESDPRRYLEVWKATQKLLVAAGEAVPKLDRKTRDRQQRAAEAAEAHLTGRPSPAAIRQAAYRARKAAAKGSIA
jgi:hypothetical protein